MIKFYDTPDEFKNNKINCNAWVATAVVGSAVIGAGANIYSSGKAADAQTDAANKSIAAQKEQQAITRGDLAPYRHIGNEAENALYLNLPRWSEDVDVTKELQDPNSTPAKAYDFTRTQGLKAVQNSAAARGLGNSGAALKGAATFATGLADNTYTNLFNMEQTNRTNAFNRLKGLLDTGENAAAQTGVLGQQSTNQVQAAQTGAGNAQAAGYNATGTAVSSAVNNIGGYAAYKGLYGGGSTGYTGGGSNAPGDASNWTGYNVTGLPNG